MEQILAITKERLNPVEGVEIDFEQATLLNSVCSGYGVFHLPLLVGETCVFDTRVANQRNEENISKTFSVFLIDIRILF